MAAKKPIDFPAVVIRLCKERDLTAYRLQQMIEERGGTITIPTIYSLLAGKTVKSDTLAWVFLALDIDLDLTKASK